MIIQLVGELAKRGAESFLIAEDGNSYFLPKLPKRWFASMFVFVEGELTGSTMDTYQIRDFMTWQQVAECASFYRSRYGAGALARAVEQLPKAECTADQWQWERIISLLCDRSKASALW